MLKLGMYVDDNDFSRWESAYRIGVINYNAKFRNKYRCSNRCITCVGNGKFISEGLKIKKVNSENAFLDFINNSINKYKISELVFTGVPRGEPLLDHPTIIHLLRLLKKEHTQILTRINSGFNCVLDSMDMLMKLKQNGLDRIAITVNALDEKAYVSFCRPIVDNAYFNHINFLKNAYTVFGDKGLIVSYINRRSENVPLIFQSGSFKQGSLRLYLKKVLNIKEIDFKIVSRGYLGDELIAD